MTKRIQLLAGFVFLNFLIGAVVQAQTPDPLHRAIKSIGGATALRREATNSEGSPNTLRYVVQGDDSYSMNLKSGWVLKMSKDGAAQAYERWRWMVPQLALADMERMRGDLNCGERRSVGGVTYEVCRFSTAVGTPFAVLFWRSSGELAGYEYEERTTCRVDALHSFARQSDYLRGRFNGLHPICLELLAIH